MKKPSIIKTYVYPCTIISVIDGDTLKVDCDLGHRIWYRSMPLRLVGIDAPELHSVRPIEVTAAMRVMQFLIKLLPTGREMVLESTASMDKYGRLMGRLSDGVNYVQDMLLALGLARPYSGGTKVPWSDEELQKIVDTQI